MSTPQPADRPAAVLVGVQLPGVSDAQHEADLAELGRLADTLGLRVVGQVSQRRDRLDAGAVLGEGKLKELASWTGGKGEIPKHKPKTSKARERWAADEGDEDGEPEAQDGEEEEETEGRAPGKATVVVVDHEVTPSQARNLEKATGAEVLDRTGVIVEIFHRHARSREAKLQVEIARLTYVAPRLREQGAGGDRQRGGIGGKGAGESAVELDRRRVRDRIAELRAELAEIQKEQDNRRAGRRGQRRVALVGYTNAGKSSLFRALTGSDVLVADQLFATLDTTVRAIHPEIRPRVLVSDTVGFIQKLPHDLVASFRSTLDEALEASLLLYVVDASDPTFRNQLQVTRDVLAEIGARDVPSLLVLNKRDRIDDERAALLASEFRDAMLVSARSPADVKRVRQTIVEFFDRDLEEATIVVPYAKQAVSAHLFEEAHVVAESWGEDGATMQVRADAATLAKIRGELG